MYLTYKKHLKKNLKGKNVNASVDFKLRTCRSVADSLSINIKHEDSEMYKIIVNFSVFDLKERVSKYGGSYTSHSLFLHHIFLTRP